MRVNEMILPGGSEPQGLEAAIEKRGFIAALKALRYPKSSASANRLAHVFIGEFIGKERHG